MRDTFDACVFVWVGVRQTLPVSTHALLIPLPSVYHNNNQADAGRIHGLVREELASFLLQQHEQQQQQQRGQGRQQQGVGWLEVGGGKKIRTYLDADALKPEKVGCRMCICTYDVYVSLLSN